MQKQIDVRIAGQERIVKVEISPETMASEILVKAGCPVDYELSPAVGQPPFGKDEKIYDRVQSGGKVIASPVAVVGGVKEEGR